MNTTYSDEFKGLIADPKSATALIEGSCVHGVDFEGWVEMRGFIANAIDRDGTLLDIGCANGFLLRCLQEWSDKNLIPYGIDPEVERLNGAKELFPEYQSHFAPIQIQELTEASRFGLPADYDLVYWNIWDNREFNDSRDLLFLATAYAVVKKGGRLILGFYHPSKENNLSRASKLTTLGYKVSQILENPSGREEVIAWIDK